MRRLKRKANASALDKTPKNTDASTVQTAVVPVNPEVFMDKAEDMVVSQSDHDNNTTNAKKELKHAVVVPTDGVIVFEEEMNKGIGTEGGEAGDGDGDNAADHDVYLASGADDITATEDEEGSEGNDEDNGWDEENNDENVAHDHDQNELENENLEEGNELENGNHEEDNVEDVKPENDEGGHVNTGKEEVKEDNPKKVGIKSQKVKLRKKASAFVDMNGKKKNAEGTSGQAAIITEHKAGQSDTAVGIKSQRGRLRKKVRVSVDMDGKKNAGGASGQSHIITEHKGGESDAGVVFGEADGGKAKEMLEEVGGESSNPKLNKLRKDSRVKAAEGGPMKVATEREDKRKLLPKKKSSQKVKTMGMIFMCNTKTKDDCFQYQVLGLPASKRETVESIYKGMRLFLYDVDLKLLHGIYKAAAPGGYNIQPKAFNSKFPSQVRFTVLDDCEPLAEEKFKRVLKDNYYTKKKFDTLLTSNQVKDLCKLFSSIKDRAPRKLDSSHRRKAPILSNRDKNLRPHRYQPYPPAYERAVIAPPIHVASHHRPPLPPPPRVVADIPYDYERAVGIDGYRREALVEHHDSYRRPLLMHRDANRRSPLLEHHDVYRCQHRQPLLDHDDLYRQDVVRHHEDEYRRPDPVISYRGVRYSGGEVGMLDPYRSYNERSYDLLPEDDVMPEYRSVRPRYGYHQY